MNMWLESIANVQRRRGPPLDMDLETGEIKPVELFACKTCGVEKPETEFYVKFRQGVKPYRYRDCRACLCDRERKKLVPVLRATAKTLILTTMSPGDRMAISQISEAIGRTRRPTDAAVKELLDEGILERDGFMTIGTNSRIPAYRKRPAE